MQNCTWPHSIKQHQMAIMAAMALSSPASFCGRAGSPLIRAATLDHGFMGPMQKIKQSGIRMQKSTHIIKVHLSQSSNRQNTKHLLGACYGAHPNLGQLYGSGNFDNSDTSWWSLADLSSTSLETLDRTRIVCIFSAGIFSEVLISKDCTSQPNVFGLR